MEQKTVINISGNKSGPKGFVLTIPAYDQCPEFGPDGFILLDRSSGKVKVRVEHKWRTFAFEPEEDPLDHVYMTLKDFQDEVSSVKDLQAKLTKGSPEQRVHTMSLKADRSPCELSELNGIVLVDTSDGDVEILLPKGENIGNGQIYTISHYNGAGKCIVSAQESYIFSSGSIANSIVFDVGTTVKLDYTSDDDRWVTL